MSASSLVRKAMNVAESLRVIRSVTICPVCTYRAAMIETVPWRTYSNSRRATRPGRAGRSRCLR